MLTCPNCRARHTCSTATNFPFAYELEELINKMRQTILGGRSSQEERKVNQMQEEQEALLKTSLINCKDILLQLTKYKSSLGEWVAEHQDLITNLSALIEANRNIQELLKKEEESVSLCLAEGEEKKQMLSLAAEALAVARTAQEVVTAVDDAECCHVTAEDWARKCQEVFPDVTTVYKSVKVGTRFLSGCSDADKLDSEMALWMKVS